LEELREELLQEERMRDDFEFALDQLGFNNHTTVGEARRIIESLNILGWAISLDELAELQTTQTTQI
jgi:hypothetical protein